MQVTRGRVLRVKRKTFAEMGCPIARSLEEVGEGWCLLILRDVFIGVRRFQDLEVRLGITASTLTRRLARLCECGLLEARAYADRPIRFEYVLTEKGEDFLPVLLALGAWGNRWFTEAIVQVDPESGERFAPLLVDAKSGRPLRAGTVALGFGPGAPPALQAFLSPPRRLGRAAARATAGGQP